MPTGLQAARWIGVSAPFQIMRKTCTACFRRPSSLAGVERFEKPDRRARGQLRARVILAGLLSAVCVAQTAAAQTLRIVATTGDLASLSRAVAGDLAQGETIIPPAAH